MTHSGDEVLCRVPLHVPETKVPRIWDDLKSVVCKDYHSLVYFLSSYISPGDSQGPPTYHSLSERLFLCRSDFCVKILLRGGTFLDFLRTRSVSGTLRTTLRKYSTDTRDPSTLKVQWVRYTLSPSIQTSISCVTTFYTTCVPEWFFARGVPTETTFRTPRQGRVSTFTVSSCTSGNIGHGSPYLQGVREKTIHLKFSRHKMSERARGKYVISYSV